MINIDPSNSKPIYEQIVDSVKENILKGILQPQDKLPSVRNLSSQLLINPNTVSKAYSELERQKVIVTIKGRGTYVSKDYNPKMEEDRIVQLTKMIKKIIVEAHYIGIDKDRLLSIIDKIYGELEGN
ncbi:GntR family transcriptional regulator [Clostridiisalibacter paucivorans]|uniref:GntR family transcriptional regulator n=1 Tax=Clostridiisalibacter paucivorans TaxID=408753 RepID=UPI00047C4FFB|nr:GntR family transcriptional regulator [Clostridiisalibacter paucivorans]